MRNLLIFLGVFVVLGLVGRMDRDTMLITTMVETCERSYQVRSGELEEKCGQLIDEAEAAGFYVSNHNGDFTAEKK